MTSEPITGPEAASSASSPATRSREECRYGPEPINTREGDERMMTVLNRKARRVGRLVRGTALVLGAAVMLSVMLVFTAGAAEAAKAKSLKAGVQNTVSALTTLVGNVTGPVLTLDNNSTASGATALDLQVEAGQAPLTVSEGAGKATNLDADSVDGRDSSEFLAANGTATDSDKLDGKDSTEYLGADQKAADADKFDGKDSTDFLGNAIKVRHGNQVRVPKSGPVVRDSFAYCQTGERFLSGGHTVADDPADPPPNNSQSGVYDTFAIEGNPVTQTGVKLPTDGGTPIGWHVGVKNNSAQAANKDVLLRTYAVCAS